MLRKMYLVSHDYLNKNKRPFTKPRKSSRVTKKRKKSLHPQDKWIATRAKIEEAAVGRKALIKAIADFMKAVLPEVHLPKIEPPPQTTIDIRPSPLDLL
jgi:hypothetical protein